ncbi:hypothetical protein phiV141_20 [Vibrio phage phiV141]|uniref:Uncharacterized protein n=1 Tax=Vibrio phage phiV141 TaxID=2723905 RepID=A0A7D7JF09_9CAUD|nr:hypothetical protein phiV141_20 [Vibrio phage phiV141]
MFNTTSEVHNGVRVHSIVGTSIDLARKTDMRAVVFYVGKSGSAIGKEYYWDSTLTGFGFVHEVLQALTDKVTENIVTESVQDVELTQADIMDAWADATITPLGWAICNSISQQD